MKVHLILGFYGCEFKIDSNKDLVLKIFNKLKSFNTNIQFVSFGEVNMNKPVGDLIKNVKYDDQKFILSMCKTYRKQYDVSHDDIVIAFIDNYGIAKDFVDGRNLGIFRSFVYNQFRALNFVTVYIFNIIKNIINVLALNENLNKDQLQIHVKQNCITESYLRESDIFFQIQLDSICTFCEARLKINKINKEVIKDLKKILSILKKSTGFISNTENDTGRFLKVDSEGKIKYGYKEIILPANQAALLIFFLQIPDGITRGRIEKLDDPINQILNKLNILYDQSRKSLKPICLVNEFIDLKNNLKASLERFIPKPEVKKIIVAPLPNNHFKYKIDRLHPKDFIDEKFLIKLK
ncbi:hypothetical protein [Aquirufa nivalisilvae]